MDIIDLNTEQLVYRGPPNVYDADILIAYFKTKYMDAPTSAGLTETKGVIFMGDSEGMGTFILINNEKGKPMNNRGLIKILKKLGGDR